MPFAQRAGRLRGVEGAISSSPAPPGREDTQRPGWEVGSRFSTVRAGTGPTRQRPPGARDRGIINLFIAGAG